MDQKEHNDLTLDDAIEKIQELRKLDLPQNIAFMINENVVMIRYEVIRTSTSDE